MAREIHKYSNFNDGPFIAINAALMEPENIEKEFFGQDENNIDKQGYFELAQMELYSLMRLAKCLYRLKQRF